MFQSLNIFKSKAEPVGDDDLARLMPKAEREAMQTEVVVATADSDAQMAQRGTAQALKDVANPSRDDIEADFAFLNDILTKVGVSETPSAAQPAAMAPAAPAQAEAQPSAPRPASVPKHVPHHKQGAAADQSKPVHAVQNGPQRSAATPAAAQAEAEPAMAQKVASAQAAVKAERPGDIYQSIVGADDAQLSLPFDAQTAPVVEEPVVDVPAPAPAAAPVHAEAAASVSHAAVSQEAPQEMVSPSAVADVDVAHALNTLKTAEADAAKPKPQVSFEIEETSSKEEIAPVRASLFSRRAKAQPRVTRNEQTMPEEGGLDTVGTPPALVRRLMSALPAAEIPQGVSDYAKARLAKDPFDRLMDEAYGT